MENDIKQIPPCDRDANATQDLSAGCFSSWLHDTRSALIIENGAEVDCGACNVCCKSSYFIHIRPEETRTLARINRKLLFAAPGMPKGNVLLGYDKDGKCPMLIDDRCSIYEDRPITCRSYDCRIFTAAGIAAGDDDKALINKQIKRWKFDYAAKSDLDKHAAVQAAAAFLQEHAYSFPGGAVPKNLSQLAILAIKVYKVFLEKKAEFAETGYSSVEAAKAAKAVIEANEEFEARRKQDA